MLETPLLGMQGCLIMRNQKLQALHGGDVWSDLIFLCATD